MWGVYWNLESIDGYGLYQRYNNITFPNHQRNMSLCFLLSLISFRKVLLFILYTYFTSLVKFIPMYFIFPGCYCEWDCFLYFIFRYSLLVFRNATNFCVFVLYLKILSDWLINSNSLLDECVIFIYKIMWITNKTILLTTFWFSCFFSLFNTFIFSAITEYFYYYLIDCFLIVLYFYFAFVPLILPASFYWQPFMVI